MSMKTLVTTKTTKNMNTTTESTYGQTALAKLNELLVGTDRANLTPTADFWEWRKENEARASWGY